MTVRAIANIRAPFLTGVYTLATIPPADASNAQLMAYATDVPGYYFSDGVTWHPICCKRFECFAGTTDASGNYSVTYAPAYATTPHVNPVTYPSADSTTRVRVTASSAAGFTVKTERNAGVTLLGIDVLLLGTSNVPSVPVRVLVAET